MAATQISVLGLFDCSLYDKVVQRLASNAHKSEAFDCEETIFERGPITTTPVSDENKVRLRSTRLASNHQQLIWTMHVLNSPETARLAPEMLSRTIISCPFVEGADHFAFLSALGYRRNAATFKRGVQFQRGIVLAQIYQVFDSPSATMPLDSSSYILSLSAIVLEPPRASSSRSNSGAPTPLPPPRSSSQDLKLDAMERIRGVKAIVKGLVDLSRVE